MKENRLNRIAQEWDTLRERMYDPVLFAGMDQEESVRWFSYFFSLPKKENSKPQPRTHALGFYDPFAKRSIFPAGLRYSCNVYVGCSHRCSYCYTQLYVRTPHGISRRKSSFRNQLEKDFAEIKNLALPPAPCSPSSSAAYRQQQ
jgi:tRNA A37 methylthiotransferase MiaB